MRVCARVSVFVCACARVCARVCVCTCAHACVDVYVRVRANMHVCASASMTQREREKGRWRREDGELEDISDEVTKARAQGHCLEKSKHYSLYTLLVVTSCQDSLICAGAFGHRES